MRLATVFSGIGAPEQACRNIFGKNGYQTVFACDNGERELNISEEDIRAAIQGMSEANAQKYINSLYEKKGANKMKASYLANYKLLDKWYEDIRFLDGKQYAGSVDLLVGGSPCQSFSNMGYRKGLDDARGTLFFNYATLISDVKPKAFIYENVPGMLMIDKGETWKRILRIFNELRYRCSFAILDSAQYGIPQHRPRLYVVGIRDDLADKPFEFPTPIGCATTMFSYLEKEVDAKYYFKEIGYRFVTTHTGRARINREIIGTQRANQQFNWNGDFVFEALDMAKHKEAIANGAKVGRWNCQTGLIRKLTPRECLNLMGFGEFNIVVDDHAMWRQSGNSMVVSVLEAIIKKLKSEAVL